MSYRVLLGNSAEKDISRLPTGVLRRVDAKLAALTGDPRPREAAKLQGKQGDNWRIRVGDYRILYEVDEEAKTVLVYRISPRGSAYKR